MTVFVTLSYLTRTTNKHWSPLCGPLFISQEISTSQGGNLERVNLEIAPLKETQVNSNPQIITETQGKSENLKQESQELHNLIGSGSLH